MTGCNERNDYERRAEDFGVKRAELEIASGAEGPVDSPLSGEYAGDMVAADLHEAVDAPAWWGAWEEEDLADAYEAGYFGTWAALER